ncbi:MAG: GNAT family N-acetyltransferase [Sedimentisphaerales bacterium]|nr:GNAT family N-acetyltransferase [Sedimentisphaerales bacterium]
MTDEYKNIRKMEVGDIDEVCKIWLTCSLIAHGFIPAGFLHSLLPKIKKQWEDNCSSNNYQMYVYKEEGSAIKGFIIIRNENNYVEELFVSPEYQGQDIGSKILDEIKKDKEFLEVNVYQLNTGAIIFYTKQDFDVKKGEKSFHIEKDTGQWKIRMRWEKDPLLSQLKTQY